MIPTMRCVPVRSTNARATRSLARCAMAWVILVIASGLGGSAASAPAKAASAAIAYRLAATYRAPAPALRAGHYARVVDVAVRPDGMRLVLDARQHALHAIGAGGLPIAVWPLPWLAEGGWVPEAIGAGYGDEAVVLASRDGAGHTRSQARFDVLGSDGSPRASWEADVRYTDVAVQADGTVLATRTRPLVPPPPSRDPGPRPRGALDAFVGGARTQTIEGDALYLPVAVDVGPDGRVWIVDWRPSPAVATLPPPAATPRPSGGGHRRLREGEGASALELDVLAKEDAEGIVVLRQDDAEGIVELSAELAVLGRHPFYDADDVAAGPGGVVVARQLEVFPLGDPDAPLWAAPSDALALGAFGSGLRVAAPADGRLEVALDHCRFQGLVRFARTSAPLGMPQTAGALAWPPLDGPRHPLAIAEGPGGLALLTGRFEPFGAPPSAVVGAADSAPQAVQRWTHEGRLIDQIGLCGGDAAWFEDAGDARRVRDVALSGDWIVAARADLVEGRLAEAPLGGWTAWPDVLAPPPAPEPDADGPIAHTVAVAAARGFGVALDAALHRLVWFDPETGAAAGATELAGVAGEAALADVALGDVHGGERLLALAEPSQRRVHVLARAEAGGALRPIARIALTFAPRRVAWLPAAPGLGDVVVLDDAGWLWRYGARGEHRAAWRAPEGDDLVDIAASADGRVYAAFRRTRAAPEEPPLDRALEVLDAGIHAFAPDAGAEPPAHAEAAGCMALGDKRAAPSSVRLGDAVTVTLAIDHRCQRPARSRRLVLVLDTSRSMAWDHALGRAVDHLVGALARLAPSDELALVTFNDASGARVLRLPGTTHASLAGALTALRPLGDSRLGPGLLLATGLVAADRPTHVVVLTDGRLADGVAAESEDLRMAGATLSFVVYPHADFSGLDARILAGYAGGDRARVLVAPAAERVAAWLAEGDQPLTPPAPSPLVVTDTLPADMRYVEGSADPPADWNPAARMLVWRTAIAPGARLRLRFRVVPSALGRRPTNVRAVAALTDATGTRHDLVLPVPWVYVWDRTLLVHRAYLPHAATRACLRPPPLAIVLALDTSSSMAEPSGAGSATKLDAARQAAARLLEGLRPGVDAAAIVAFDAAARTVAPLGASPAERVAALDGLATAPGTALDLGLDEAGRALSEAPAGATKALILLSDGRTSGRPEDALRAAADLAAAGVLRYTVGLGEGADAALLAAIASEPEAFANAPSAADLDGLFARLLERVRCARG